MKRRLAVAISGAVSLGCFEAGALFESIKAIAEHNQNCKDESEQIEIDALVGASAGGMTAAIAAQKLLFEDYNLTDTQNNALYRPWVEVVDILDLLDSDKSEDKLLSLLSSNAIERISKEFLTKRYSAKRVEGRSAHAAAARNVRLGLALSNINGIDYSVQVYPNQAFTYTRFQDYLSWSLGSEQDSLDTWEVIRNAAVSCGAFPFAFRVKELDMQQDLYLRRGAKGFPQTEGKYAFTDGGLFQNEPLGLAKSLVDDIDQHLHQDSRYYLYIAPGEKTTQMNPSPLRASQAKFLPLAVELAKIVFYQARFHDWITAEEVNSKIALLDERADGLLEAMRTKESGLNPADMLKVSQPLLQILFERNDEKIQKQKQRLKAVYSKELESIRTESEQFLDAWLEAVLVLESAGDLTRKDKMKIYGITAHESDLACAKLMAFQGFFDRSLREHDYQIGRRNARWVIRHLDLKVRLPDDDSDLQIDQSLNGFDLTRLNKKQKSLTLKRIRQRIGPALKALDIPWYLRGFVENAIIIPYFEKHLFGS